MMEFKTPPYNEMFGIIPWVKPIKDTLPVVMEEIGIVSGIEKPPVLLKPKQVGPPGPDDICPFERPRYDIKREVPPI